MSEAAPGRDTELRVGIAIPVHHGENYLASAIESVLAQDSKNLDLLVSVGDGSQDALDIARQFHDSRLRIVTPPRDMSMAAHYEWCLDQLKGDWLTILGQDDGLMPHFIDTVGIITERHPIFRALSFRRAYFFWPGTEQTYGPLQVRGEFIDRIKPIQGDIAVSSVIAGLREHYDLPQVYTNNLIHRSVITELKSRLGDQWILEPTPDVFSGVAIALHLKEFLRIELPVFWTGTSTGSSGYSITSHRSLYSVNDLPEHFLRAQEEGRSVSPVVGPELWLSGANSSLFAISAVDSLARRNGMGTISRERQAMGLGSALTATVRPFGPAIHSPHLRRDIRHALALRLGESRIRKREVSRAVALSVLARMLGRVRAAWHLLRAILLMRRVRSPGLPFRTLSELNAWVTTPSVGLKVRTPGRLGTAIRWRH